MMTDMATPAPNLILGGNGMLAQAVRRTLARRGRLVVAVDRAEADLTDPAQVAAVFEKHQPGVVYNCAAYTAVDKAEQEEELANRVNGELVRLAAEACGKIGAKLVHVSTDFVFDGSATSPYSVDDEPSPISAYGRSKLLGERLLREVDPSGWIIARTAWLYGPGGNSFARTMATLAEKGTPLSVVADQHGSPTMTHDLADALVNLADARASGVFHVTNAGQTTWHGFTAEILRQFKLSVPLTKSSAADWAKKKPDAAKRPAYSVLDLSTYEQATGHTMRPWQDALAEFRNVTAALGEAA
jgi:dTDP-4-dehydrorhamnose reductase